MLTWLEQPTSIEPAHCDYAELQVSTWQAVPWLYQSISSDPLIVFMLSYPVCQGPLPLESPLLAKTETQRGGGESITLPHTAWLPLASLHNLASQLKEPL